MNGSVVLLSVRTFLAVDGFWLAGNSKKQEYKRIVSFCISNHIKVLLLESKLMYHLSLLRRLKICVVWKSFFLLLVSSASTILTCTMAGVVLENISTKKLVVISVFLLSLSLAFFLMGGLLGKLLFSNSQMPLFSLIVDLSAHKIACISVPQAVHTQVTLGTWCHLNSSRDWHASRPSSDACRIISQGRDDPVLLEDHVCC